MKHFLLQRFSRLKPSVLLAGFLLFLIPQISWGQLLIPSSTAVTQNFDGLGVSATASLPTGFKFAAGATPSYSGTTTSATTAVAGTSGTGALTSSSSGGDYNFANGVTASSTDRSIGFLTTGTVSSPRVIMLGIKNTSGSNISDLTIAFDYEKYRTGTRAFDMNFYTSPDGTTWTAVAAGNQTYGTDGANAVVNPPTTISKSVSLTGVNIANNGFYYFRWSYVGNGGATNAQGLAIDNLSITPTLAVPTPAITLNTIGFSDFGTFTVGATSATQSFSITGANLTNNISVSCPGPEFKISSTGAAGSFSNSTIGLTQVGGNASATIYVNYTPSAATAQTGTITVSSTGATDKTVSLSGTGTNATFAPTVSTAAITYLQTNAAVSGGDVTSDGGSTIMARGIVWDVASNPTIALTTKTSESGTTGAFSSNISSILPNTLYYVRAYATNANGTSYGSEVSFTTLREAPTVQASAITFSAATSTSLSFNWTVGDGGQRVVILNTSNSFTNPVDGTNPTASNTYVSGEQVVYNGSGNSVTVYGLNPGTTYWARVYEFNNFDTNTKYLTTPGVDNPLSQATLAASCLSEGFAAGTTAPTNWTFTSIGGTYPNAGFYGAATPALQFDASNDRVVTPLLSGPAQSLSFWYKGNSTTGSSLLVEGSVDGTTNWFTVENITSLPSTGAVKTIFSGLGGAYKFRFTYTKSAGNLGLDDIQVVCGAVVPAITGTSISGTTPYCANSTTNTTFSFVGIFNADGNGNKFAVELSDANGSFTSPTVIGLGSASPVTATFPAGAATGTGYKIRVTGINPVTSGPETSAFGINALPGSNIATVAPTADQTINTNTTGTTLTATVANTSTFVWKYGTVSGTYTNTISGATSATYQPKGSDFSAAGTYYVAVVTTSSCGSVVGTSDPVTIIVNNAQPAVVVSTNGPLNFNAPVNGQSAQQSYTVSGSALTGDIQITPPANFLISQTSGSSYSTAAINLTPTLGVVTTKTIYVVYAPTAQSASHGGDLSNASAGATTANVALTGNSMPAISHTGGSFTAISNQIVTSSSTGQAFVAVGTNLTGNLVITAPSHFEVSKTSASSGFSSTITLNSVNGSFTSGNFWIRYSPTTVNSHSGNVTLAVATDNVSENIAVGGTSIDFPIPAAGILLMEDDFEGTATTLLSANGWSVHSGTTAAMTNKSGNLSYSNYASSNIGNSTLISSSGEEDVNKPFTAVNRGASNSYVYSSFLVNVESIGSSEEYFFCLSPTNTNTYTIRTFVKPSGTTGKINFGVGLVGGNAVYSPIDYDLNTTYLLAIKYTFNTSNQGLELFVNPSTVFEPVSSNASTSQTTSIPTSILKVVLRQNSGGPKLTIDGIRVGTGWGSVLGNPTFSDAASTLAAGNYRDITVDAANASTVTLSGAAKVYGALTLKKGKLITDATNLLTLKDGATVVLPTAGNVSFIDGPMAYEVATAGIPTTLNLPVGKGNNYRPIVLDVTQTSAIATTYTAEQHEGAPAPKTFPGNTLDHVSTVRYFSITQSPVNALTEGIVQLSYGADDKVNKTEDLRIAKSNGTTWMDLGNADVANGVITSSENFTSFSDFVLANAKDGGNPLPVELLTFSATAENKAVKLNWSTASEKNADRFEVERSANGNEFVKVTTVKAAGNSTNELNYNAIDTNPIAGISYYRLKQIDLNGASQYSKILTVKQEVSGREVSLYPNPASNLIALKLPNTDQAEIQVVNLLGQVVLKQTIRNTDETTLNLETLPVGTYQLIVNGQTFQTIKKFVKLNK
jgi:hypothetical protein